MTVYKTSLNPKLHNKNFTKLGFPRVEHYEPKYRLNFTLFQNRVRQEIIDMDDPEVPEEIKQNIEFTIDTSDPKQHKLEINVKRNETRAAELKKIRIDFRRSIYNKSTHNLIDNNVMLFYIDSLSRASLKRAMPKTFEWLGQFVDSDSHLSAHEFFRYHSYFQNTYPSVNMMFFGNYGDFKNSNKNIFTKYSEAGYIVGSFRDMCELDSTKIYKHGFEISDPNQAKYDHLAAGFACDFNYDRYDGSGTIGFMQGKNSIFTR